MASLPVVAFPGLPIFALSAQLFTFEVESLPIRFRDHGIGDIGSESDVSNSELRS